MHKYIGLVRGLFTGFSSESRQSMIDALLSVSMAVLHDIYRNMRLRRCFLDAAMCGLFAWGARDIIMIMGWGLEWADIVSVIIVFLGVDYIGHILRIIIGRLINVK